MKSKPKPVLIEQFQGFDIYFDSEENIFRADKPELDRHFESRNIRELKEFIEDSKGEEVNKLALIKSGYFEKEISKIQVLTVNTARKTTKYRIIADTTKNKYDVDKIVDESDKVKLYSLSPENLIVERMG